MKIPRKVLITGASGFVGSNTLRLLLECGWQAGVLYLPQPDGSSSCSTSNCAAFPYLGNYESVHECISAFRPEVVIHFASLFLAKHEAEDISPLMGANILLGTYILEAMSKEGTRYFVNTGTSWQHYQSNGYNPVCLYAATKQAFEDILQYYVEARGIRAVTLKLLDTYGPDDERPKLLNLLRTVMRSGETLKMSPGEQCIDLIHVADVARAFKHATELLISDEIGPNSHFAVRSESQVSLRELVALMARLAGKEIRVEFGALPYRDREVMKPWRGEVLPGWAPQIALEKGLREFLEARC